MELSAGKLWGLRRLADESGRFKMLAVDQRPPIENLVADRRATARAPYDDVCAVKALLVAELGSSASAVLLDPHYAYPAAVHLVRPASGLVLTLEDSVFDETTRGRRSSSIDNWSVEKIKRAGCDAVKVLAWYRPDADAAVLDHQQGYVAAVGAECAKYDIPFVFELLVYPMPGDAGQTTDYVEHPGKRAEHVLESVETFADRGFGVDLFKLESPLPAANVPTFDDDDAAATQSLFTALGRAAGRPWVMLSAGATQAAFRRVLQYAYAAGANGYLAGRAIWWDAFQAFPDLESMRNRLSSDGVAYMGTINQLTDREADPWHKSPLFRGAGPELAGSGAAFRDRYSGFESAP